MAVEDSILTNNAKKIMLYRTYTPNASLSSTDKLPPTKFKVGINNIQPSITDTDLVLPIPISNGTIIDNGANTLTGGGAGSNSTDNTTIYKEGGGQTDNKSQNLIKTDTNTQATWKLESLSTAFSTSKYIGLWIYIKDSTALNKFATTGTALSIRIGSDLTTNYYYKNYTASQLAVGWNWLCDGKLLSTWDVTGTPSTLDDFMIIINTNNASDTFSAGDVCYDLMRQWEYSDTISDFVSGYPIIDYTNNEVTFRCYLNSTQANGFSLNGLGIFNQDTTPLLFGEDTFNSESKSSMDELIFIVKDRII